MVAKTVNHLIAPLARRVRLTVSRCVITAVNDTLKEQGVQITLLDGEVRDCERYQEYGFTSVPQTQAEGVAVFVGGCRDHGLVIATGDRRYRLKGLAAGEVALYTDEGDFIKLGRNHVVEVQTMTLLVKAATKARMETPLLEVTGEIKDRCDADGRSMEQMRTTYDSHTHPENDNGGPTGSPNQSMG